MMIIREIKSTQIKSYKEFLQYGLIKDEESFRISPGDDLTAPFPTKDVKDSFTLGAFIDGVLAGVVSFARDGNDREKLRHKGILFRMYVSKDFRGRGIAKDLIKNVIERAKLLDFIEQINLTVITTNINAKNLYEKLGFKTFGSEKNAIKWKDKYFNEDSMVLFLKRNLAPRQKNT
jgi:ribosomal protein S18 acetylase RimI-like enzyme